MASPVEPPDHLVNNRSVTLLPTTKWIRLWCIAQSGCGRAVLFRDPRLAATFSIGNVSNSGQASNGTWRTPRLMVVPREIGESEGTRGIAEQAVNEKLWGV